MARTWKPLDAVQVATRAVQEQQRGRVVALVAQVPAVHGVAVTDLQVEFVGPGGRVIRRVLGNRRRLEDRASLPGVETGAAADGNDGCDEDGQNQAGRGHRGTATAEARNRTNAYPLRRADARPVGRR
jgi:hypothetical protein